MNELDRLRAAVDERAEEVCTIRSREDKRRMDSREAWLDGFREGAFYAIQSVGAGLASKESV